MRDYDNMEMFYKETFKLEFQNNIGIQPHNKVHSSSSKHGINYEIIKY